MQNFLFAIESVGPVFLIVLLGYYLRKQVFSEASVAFSSRLVFSTALPALIFISIATARFSNVFDPYQILFACAGTLLFFIVVWIGAALFVKDPRDQGVFVQGSFRSNFAIIGFALVARTFSDEAVSRAALLLAFIMPLYNILAVIVLTVPLHRDGSGAVKKSVAGILRNPLIAAALLGIPFSLFKVRIPSIALSTLGYLSSLTLPLALLAIGASLNRRTFKESFALAAAASSVKVLILPVILTTLAVFAGFRGEKLGVLFILFASPTAIASFSMADAMGSNSKLAGNIVLLSTLASAFTVAGGIFILKSFGLLS